MSTWQDGFVQSNGIQLHYTRTGRDYPPMLMAHGITDNGLCWSRLAQKLERYHELFMVDARGHGQSDKPEHGYAPADHAADLAGFIRAMNIAPTLVIGHSMGGVTSAVLAAEYPELVSALILEDPAWRVPGGPEDSEAVRQLRAAEWGVRIASRAPLSVEELTRQGRLDNPSWSTDEFDAWAAAKQQVSPAVTEFVLSSRHDWPQTLEKIQCPVLLLYGDPARGGIISPALAAEAARINPRLRPVQLAEAGHNVRREQFDEYLAAVREFLAMVQRTV